MAGVKTTRFQREISFAIDHFWASWPQGPFWGPFWASKLETLNPKNLGLNPKDLGPPRGA